MEFRPVAFDDFPVRCDFSLLRPEHQRVGGILRARVGGTFGVGSGGNIHSRYLCGIIAAAHATWRPSALLLDLSGLTYTWGDTMADLLDVGGDLKVPSAIVVGPACHRALATLMFQDVNTTHTATEREGVFDALQPAVDWLARKI